jgi:hypothetical protein
MLLLLVAPTLLAAQRRCVKGIPCGGSCIAANRVCRIGAPEPDSRTAKDTLRPSAPAVSAQSALIQSRPETVFVQPPLPAVSPSLYESFVAALLPWRSKPVQLHNSSETVSLRGPALLVEVLASHLVLSNSINRAMVPYSSIEMVYAEKDPNARDALLTIVIRR